MIALITPTGARPAQMQLCAKWMARQTYAGAVCWVIVDDCLPATTDHIKADFRAGWHILHVRPRPVWQAGQNTQGRNLCAGMTALLAAYKTTDIEAIAIIEDDDYYSACYLAEMVRRLGNFNLIGETHTLYYNVYYRRYHENQNAEWSSLFQTMFTPALLPVFAKLYTEKFIDYAFFRLVDRDKLLFRCSPKLAIGIKGMTGRTGIGAGHRFTTYLRPDTCLLTLHEYIGDDVKYYIDYWDCGGTQYKSTV
jgi:hypothetical protein